MSESFFCLDCNRSVTFLKVGSTKHTKIMMQKSPIETLFDSSLTYVRCSICIVSKGRLSSGENPTEFVFEVPRETQKTLIKNIATFMKKSKWEIAVVTRGSPDMSEKPAHMNIDEALETYMHGLACVSLDCGGPTSAYTDFYTKIEWNGRQIPDINGRQIPDIQVNSQTSSYSDEKIASRNRKVPHIANFPQSSDLDQGKSIELSSYSERTANQIRTISNAIEGPVVLFCPYCNLSERGACHGNSFLAREEETKVKMFPYKLTTADTLVIFTCDIHVSTHLVRLFNLETEVHVYKTCSTGLLKLWDDIYPIGILTNRRPYARILNICEPHTITQLDLELGMWGLWSGYYENYFSELGASLI